MGGGAEVDTLGRRKSPKRSLSRQKHWLHGLPPGCMHTLCFVKDLRYTLVIMLLLPRALEPEGVLNLCVVGVQMRVKTMSLDDVSQVSCV